VETKHSRTLLEGLAARLDRAKVVSIKDPVTRSGKYSRAADSRPAGGLPAMLDPPGHLVGDHRGRAVSVRLHSGGELKIIVHCDARCRFRITTNNLAARLNLLAGRRVESGIQDFDDRFIIRSQGPFDLGTVFERSDVAQLLPFLEPFFQLTVEPGSMIMMSNVGSGEDTRAEDVRYRLEYMIEFACILEEASSDILSQESHVQENDSEPEGTGK